MKRWAMLAAAAALWAPTAWAATRAETAQVATVTERFEPFDKAAGNGWAAATPKPLYLLAATGKSAGAPLRLQPGAYRIVVLCACNLMDVTLVGPDAHTIPAERKDDHGAMYSLDVPAAGSYLTGVDMDDCGQKKCAVGVKVYRKTS